MRKVAGTTDLQLQLRWRSDFDYCIDVFDEGFFDSEITNFETSHRLYSNTKGKDLERANCMVTTKGKKAIVEYSEKNNRSDIKVGKLIIHFTDKTRKFVERVDWHAKSGKKHDKDVAETNWKVPDEVLEGKQRNKEIELLSRNASLMEKRKRNDKYCCNACGYKVQVGGKYIVDCHHTNMVSKGQRITNIGELLTLCPNCHRIAHTNNPPLRLEKIKAELKKNGIQVVINK